MGKDISKEKVLILGAGPAGMGAAFELDKAGRRFLVIEKNSEIGGLARTIRYGEFRTDIGPHRFFAQNQYIYDIVEGLLKEEWHKVERLTRFYIDGKFFYYPIRLKDVLGNVKIEKAFRILCDYLSEKIKALAQKKAPSSFEDYVISEFGRSLAELNMLNYTEKIWGLPSSKISSDWARERIKGLSLTGIIRNLVINPGDGTRSLVDRFYYPDYGTGAIYERIKDKILNSKEIFKLNSRPLKIFHNGEKIIGVIVNIEGENKVVTAEYIISSIPITELVNLLEPAPSQEVLKASRNLKFRAHISLFITFNKPSVFQDQWLYFPEKEIHFGRIMEPKNFSPKMSPLDKTSLLIEFFSWENDALWRSAKEDLLRLSAGWLEKLGFIRKDEIIDSYVHREAHAYPVYDLGYDRHLKTVKEFLKNFKNLQIIGRGGAFRYNNQDQALEMGILAARDIIG